jgi:hypothetical protein
VALEAVAVHCSGDAHNELVVLHVQRSDISTTVKHAESETYNEPPGPLVVHPSHLGLPPDKQEQQHAHQHRVRSQTYEKRSNPRQSRIAAILRARDELHLSVAHALRGDFSVVEHAGFCERFLLVRVRDEMRGSRVAEGGFRGGEGG